MPTYEFVCKTCRRQTDEALPMTLRDDKDLFPVCCGGPMARIVSGPPHRFLVPPTGQYYETIGAHASTEAEFRRKAEKVKSEQREYFHGEK